MSSIYNSLLIPFILVSFYRIILCQSEGQQHTSIADHEAWEPLCKLSGVEKPFDEKPIPDCNCHVYSVDQAVNSFISPLLSNLTER
jgi:hypothetical protein